MTLFVLMFFVLMFFVVIGTTIWVGIDASNLGMRPGRLGGGFVDMGPAGWVIGCLLLWIVAFPVYLAARSRYKNMTTLRFAHSGHPVSAQTWGGNAMPHRYSPAMPGSSAMPQMPVQTVYSPLPPLQTSPDGRWWWDGAQWNPVPVVRAPAPQRPVNS
jgi:hypothetical protein